MKMTWLDVGVPRKQSKPDPEPPLTFLVMSLPKPGTGVDTGLYTPELLASSRHDSIASSGAIVQVPSAFVRSMPRIVLSVPSPVAFVTPATAASEPARQVVPGLESMVSSPQRTPMFEDEAAISGSMPSVELTMLPTSDVLFVSAVFRVALMSVENTPVPTAKFSGGVNEFDAWRTFDTTAREFSGPVAAVDALTPACPRTHSDTGAVELGPAAVVRVRYVSSQRDSLPCTGHMSTRQVVLRAALAA